MAWQLYPGSIYETSGWRLTVRLWEGVMWALFGVEGASLVWLAALAAGLGLRWAYVRRRLRLRGRRKASTTSGSGVFRDLDV